MDDLLFIQPQNQLIVITYIKIPKFYLNLIVKWILDYNSSLKNTKDEAMDLIIAA